MPAMGCELIPGRLAWAPEQRPGHAGGCRTVDALGLCRYLAAPGSAAGTYEVSHYPRAACGRAFGPLGLESVLRFCRGLAEMLEALPPDGGALVLVTPAGSAEQRANAAVLLGSYLVLRHGWTAAGLAAHLGAADAGAKFACSWGRQDRPPTERVMRVRDCWAGVELAKLQGWIDPGILEDDISMEVACAEHEEQIAFYDTAWIIPGMLMVGADPTTTVFDRNPTSCQQMFPGDEDKGISTCSMEEVTRFPTLSPRSTQSVCDSLDTVCKDFSLDVIGRSTKEEEGTGADGKRAGRDFTSFLRRSGVGMIVRANLNDEAGLPGRASYGDHAFEAYGLAQANIRVVDKNGGLPQPSDVARLLEVCEGFMQQEGEDAVLVHCKGGFGGSVVLACCLAISRLDVPGAALLGWVRVARPGAVTTRAQELFLVSLKGRKDVLRYARVPMMDEQKGGVGLSCGNPCQIQ